MPVTQETQEAKRTVTRRVKNAILFSDGTIRLDNCRLSYPWVTKPQENTGDDGKTSLSYSCQALMPKATHGEAMKLCRDVIRTIVADKLKDQKLKDIAADRKFIRDGDQMAKEECVDHWVVSSREKNPPKLRGATNDPSTGKPVRLDPEKCDGLFYGGCYGAIIIRPWWQDNKYGKRVNAGLSAVQFLRDGEPFGEGRITDDDIDDSFEGAEDEGDGGWADDNGGL